MLRTCSRRLERSKLKICPFCYLWLLYWKVIWGLYSSLDWLLCSYCYLYVPTCGEMIVWLISIFLLMFYHDFFLSMIDSDSTTPSKKNYFSCQLLVLSLVWNVCQESQDQWSTAKVSINESSFCFQERQRQNLTFEYLFRAYFDQASLVTELSTLQEKSRPLNPQKVMTAMQQYIPQFQLSNQQVDFCLSWSFLNDIISFTKMPRFLFWTLKIAMRVTLQLMYNWCLVVYLHVGCSRGIPSSSLLFKRWIIGFLYAKFWLLSGCGCPY